jgi:GNAT superfamily N-acetyltransferase
VRIVVEFLMTKHPSRGKGYASAIMDWATELADDLNCACYLDGGGRGMGICERAGFEAQDVGDRYGDIPPSVPMLRPKKEQRGNKRKSG